MRRQLRLGWLTEKVPGWARGLNLSSHISRASTRTRHTHFFLKTSLRFKYFRLDQSVGLVSGSVMKRRRFKRERDENRGGGTTCSGWSVIKNVRGVRMVQRSNTPAPRDGITVRVQDDRRCNTRTFPHVSWMIVNINGSFFTPTTWMWREMLCLRGNKRGNESLGKRWDNEKRGV